MILSVSRRTDIPQFYCDWFFNRLKERYVFVRNPFNPRQISKVEMTESTIDALVFWSKNPAPLFKRWREIDFPFGVQFTLTPYDCSIEESVEQKKKLIDLFGEMGQVLGKERMVLRYDPILFTKQWGSERHMEAFEKTFLPLKDSLEKCVINFLIPYKKTARNFEDYFLPEEPLKKKLIQQMANLTHAHGVRLEGCLQPWNQGIEHFYAGACLNAEWIEKITQKKWIKAAKKDSGQNPECGCVTSIDIGAYDTCPHGCRYCYANHTLGLARENYKKHDPHLPLLGEKMTGQETVSLRKMVLQLEDRWF